MPILGGGILRKGGPVVELGLRHRDTAGHVSLRSFDRESLGSGVRIPAGPLIHLRGTREFTVCEIFVKFQASVF